MRTVSKFSPLSFLYLLIKTDSFLAPVYLLHEPDFIEQNDRTTSHSISTREARKRARSSGDYSGLRQYKTPWPPTTTTIAPNDNRGKF